MRAAAGTTRASGEVRVFNRETGGRVRLFEINDRSVEEFCKLLPRHDRKAVHFEPRVRQRVELIIERQRIAKPRAAAARDPDAQEAVVGNVLLLDHVFDFFVGQFCNRNHFDPILSISEKSRQNPCTDAGLPARRSSRLSAGNFPSRQEGHD